MPKPTRDPVFFASDVWSAAETAALAVADHGLTDDQAEELAEVIEIRILKFFEEENSDA